VHDTDGRFEVFKRSSANLTCDLHPCAAAPACFVHDDDAPCFFRRGDNVIEWQRVDRPEVNQIDGRRCVWRLQGRREEGSEEGRWIAQELDGAHCDVRLAGR
jgi:hypothetical protein